MPSTPLPTTSTPKPTNETWTFQSIAKQREEVQPINGAVLQSPVAKTGFLAKAGVKWWMVVTVGTLLFLGAVGGIVAGVVVANQSSDDDDTAVATPTPTPSSSPEARRFLTVETAEFDPAEFETSGLGAEDAPAPLAALPEQRR